MHFTAPLLTLLSILPLLASATPEAQPAGGLVIKQVDLSQRKRQAAGSTTTGGAYVTSWTQCTQVCDGYFGKPVASSTTIAANNAAVVTSTSKASSVAAASSARSSVASSAVTTRASTSSTSRASTSTSSSTRSTTAATSSSRATTVASSSTRAATTSTSIAAPATSNTSRVSSAVISSARSTSAAPAATSTAGGTTTAAQRQLILDLHNAERRDYGASPLTWNLTLEKYALDWASKCQWKHSQGPYGENLAASYGSPDAISVGINGWNAERTEYNPAAPMYSHWTQVVWKGTTEVGCVVVKCPGGSIQPGWPETQYLVCEYQKPGNYAGQYAANVGTRVAA